MGSLIPENVAPSSNDPLVDLLDALTDIDSPEISEPALGSIAQIDDPDRLAAFIFSAWARMRRANGAANIAILRSVVERLGDTAKASEHVRCTFDYLLLWAEVCAYFKRNRLGFVTPRDLFRPEGGHIEELGKSIRGWEPVLTTDYGKLMLEGMLASGRSRVDAAELFSRARAACPELAVASDLDHFASTYFTPKQIAGQAPENTRRRMALANNFQYIVEPAAGERQGVQLLFSCDPSFFKIYFPYWASVAGWLRHLDVQMHFVMVAERNEASHAVKSALDLLDALAGFRGVDAATFKEPISFSSVAAPTWIANLKTFYACARYLFASTLGSRFEGRVLVVDIDTRVTRDPTTFFRYLRGLASEQIAVVPARGVSCLVPARRFMGSTFLVCRNMQGNGSPMRHIEDYMYAALSSPTSWTLDQGALDYMAHCLSAKSESESVVDLSQLPRPFAQEPIRQFYRAAARWDGE